MKVLAGLVAALLALPAAAQTWRVVPRITLTETWTDSNNPQDPSAGSRWITNLSPSVNVEHKGPRLLLSGDYRYQRDFYRDDTGDTARNFLSSVASYEALENQLWIEGRASITQERRSAFDAAVVEGMPGANANRSETRLYSFGPRLRGELGEQAQYALRVAASSLRSGDLARIDTREMVATLRSPPRLARLGWSLDGSAMRTRSDGFGTLDDARASASLIVGVTPQVSVSAVGGVEKTDFSTEPDKRRTTSGLGFQWSPGSRTQLAAVAQRRYFGTGHLATFTHRGAQAAIKLGSRRDASVLSGVLGAGAVTLDTLMSDLLAASYPDPVARAQAVRSRLAAFGSAPTSVRGGFVTERPFLNEAIDGTVALIGARNTLTVGFARRSLTALLDSATIGDSFSDSRVIRESEVTAGLSHRLTRATTVTFSSARLRSKGDAPGAPSARQALDTIFLTTQLGTRTSATLGLRRLDFVGAGTLSYDERAVFGSISYRL